MALSNWSASVVLRLPPPRRRPFGRYHLLPRPSSPRFSGAIRRGGRSPRSVPRPYFCRSIPPETTRTISPRPRVRFMPLSASSCIPFFSSSNNKDREARRDRSPSLSRASSSPPPRPSAALSGSEDRSSRIPQHWAVLRLRPPPPLGSIQAPPPRLVPSSFPSGLPGAPH